MKKISVWLIDDEIELGELFVDIFSSPSCSVTYFNDSSEALISLEKEQPDLFFLDYRMPKMDGDELASILPKDIPKYLITGEINPVVKSNFIEILEKPYNLKKIFKIIESLQNQIIKSA